MARVHAHPRSMGPKMDSISLRYFGLRPSQPVRLALVDPTDKYLRTWKPIPSCILISNACLLPPSPSSNGRLLHTMARRKATAEELEAQAKSNGYKRGAHREKDSTRDNGKHNKKTKRSQNSVLDRYVS
jgi:hypothetical protein